MTDGRPAARRSSATAAFPAGAIVLIRTGFSSAGPTPRATWARPSAASAAVAKLHFPGLHPDAARWLVANRPIKAIGIDTASIDYGQSTLFESHRALYGTRHPGVREPDGPRSPAARAAPIVALPMKIGGGSGAPLRAIAILPS